jgi:hypothetical protein
MAAVGGYTSVLELKPEASGFNQANKLLKELYDNLKNIKDIAGSLNNMKLTVKLDDGQSSQANHAMQEEKRKRAEENRLLREWEKKVRTSGGTLSTPGRADVMDTDKEKAKYDKAKEANNLLKDFSTMLKWTIGVLSTFKAALELGKAISNNATVQSGVLNQADKYGMDPMAMLTLRRISTIYNPNHESTGFDNALQNLFNFKTDPGLKGQLDTGLALTMSQGLGTEITSGMFDKESMQSILFRVFKGYSEKMKNGTRGDKDRANSALATLTGQSGADIGLMLSSQGKSLEQAFRDQAGNITNTTGSQREVSIEIGESIANFQQIWDSFMSKLGKNLLEPLKKVNDWLEANRGTIENFTSFLANVFSLNFEGIQGNLKSADKVWEKDRQDRISKSGISLEQYNKFQSLGLLSDTRNPFTNDIVFINNLKGYSQDKFNKDDLKELEKESAKRDRLKNISNLFGGTFNPSDINRTESDISSKLGNLYKSGKLNIPDLEKILNSDQGLQYSKNAGRTGDFESYLKRDILQFIQELESKEGKVEIIIRMPDGSTQKQKISLQKSQSMMRDNDVAGNYEMTGSGVSA